MGHVSSISSGVACQRDGSPPIAPLAGFDESGRRAEALQGAERPVVAMAAEFESGSVGSRHSHRRIQFLHSLTGVMTVITEGGSWTVSPQHALLIPAGVVHQSRCWGTVQLRTLYIEPEAAIGLAKECRLIQASSLVRALLNEAVTFPVEYDLDGRESQIMSLILSEIGRMPAVPLRAPMPHDRRLARICEAILRDPGSSHDLEYWSQLGGLGRRTLTRLFRRETGMSFGEWRQQVTLMEALSRLTMREPVTNVALDLGYDSPSAFSAMFRRSMGISPRDYLRWSEDKDVELVT
jgi:AraC-like DNA-binding protein/mannose-6-phosphate isomerase-like protein (cupin superfamily)